MQLSHSLFSIDRLEQRSPSHYIQERQWWYLACFFPDEDHPPAICCSQKENDWQLLVTESSCSLTRHCPQAPVLLIIWLHGSTKCLPLPEHHSSPVLLTDRKHNIHPVLFSQKCWWNPLKWRKTYPCTDYYFSMPRTPSILLLLKFVRMEAQPSPAMSTL